MIFAHQKKAIQADEAVLFYGEEKISQCRNLLRNTELRSEKGKNQGEAAEAKAYTQKILQKTRMEISQVYREVLI